MTLPHIVTLDAWKPIKTGHLAFQCGHVYAHWPTVPAGTKMTGIDRHVSDGDEGFLTLQSPSKTKLGIEDDTRIIIQYVNEYFRFHNPHIEGYAVPTGTAAMLSAFQHFGYEDHFNLPQNSVALLNDTPHITRITRHDIESGIIGDFRFSLDDIACERSQLTQANGEELFGTAVSYEPIGCNHPRLPVRNDCIRPDSTDFEARSLLHTAYNFITLQEAMKWVCQRDTEFLLTATELDERYNELFILDL